MRATMPYPRKEPSWLSSAKRNRSVRNSLFADPRFANFAVGRPWNSIDKKFRERLNEPY
jgi:hypothetical protein